MVEDPVAKRFRLLQDDEDGATNWNLKVQEVAEFVKSEIAGWTFRPTVRFVALDEPTRFVVADRVMASYGNIEAAKRLAARFPCRNDSSAAVRASLLQRADKLELTPLPTIERWAEIVKEVAALRAQAAKVNATRCGSCYQCRDLAWLGR